MKIEDLPPDFFQLNPDVEKDIVRRIKRAENNKNHTHAYGWSKVGYCLMQQVLSAFDWKDFKNYGKTAPGNLIHRYFQHKIYPIGSDINGYEVIGHEHNVITLDEKGRVYNSQIDTVLHNRRRNEFMVFDYKSVANLDNIKQPTLPHILQVNLYGTLIKAKTCRIIYISKTDFEKTKTFEFTASPLIGFETIKRLSLITDLKTMPETEMEQSVCIQYFEGRTNNACHLCEHKKYCDKLIAMRFGETEMRRKNK